MEVRGRKSEVRGRKCGRMGNCENSAVEAMHRIKEIGKRSKEALESGDYVGFGKLLDEHWRVKKSITVYGFQV